MCGGGGGGDHRFYISCIFDVIVLYTNFCGGTGYITEFNLYFY